MAEVFVGIEETLSYTGEGVKANPCLAVDLAMLGVGTVEECHDTLVKLDISTGDGISRMPDDGADIEINGNTVVFGEARIWFDVDSVIEDAVTQFEDGSAAIVAVKLNEEDLDDEAMHLILLAGQFVRNGKRGDVLVGDSLRDGMLRESVIEVDKRLQRTLDWAGALFSYHVSVTQVSEK